MGDVILVRDRKIHMGAAIIYKYHIWLSSYTSLIPFYPSLILHSIVITSKAYVSEALFDFVLIIL